MGLRRKTTIVICVSLVLLTLLMYLSLRQVLMENVLIQENQDVREDMVRVINAFENEKRDLHGTASDWAQWDDAYNFVLDGNQEFINSNIIDATFIHLKVNFFVFIDNSGKLVFSRSFDLSNNAISPVPAGLNSAFKPGSPLIQNKQAPGPLTGLLILPETPILISSFPVIRSDGKGDIGGTLLMGRYINADYTTRLSEITNLQLETKEISKIEEHPDYKSAYLVLSSQPVAVQTVDRETVAGYAVLNDIYGKPAMLARVQTPRDMFKHGMSLVYYAGFFVIIEGLLMGLLILYLMERLVLSRLLRLSKEIKHIGKTGLGIKVTQDSQDELGQLAGAIDNMLVDLQATSLEITNILESISDSFVSYDENLRYTYINKAAEQMLGIDRNVLIRQKMEENQPQFAALVLDKYRQVLSEKKAQHFEVYFDFQSKWLELHVYPKENGISVYFRDVSERKLKEDMVLRQSEELFFRAFHGNPIMMAILSTERGTFIDANEVLLKTLGYTREELIDHTVFDMKVLLSNDATKKWVSLLLDTGKLENVEIDFYTRHGELRHGLLWSYLFYFDGMPCHLAAIIDITEQKRIQEEFQRLDRLNLVGEIAAGIAHEIRNPMTTVRGLLQMLNEHEKHLQNHPYLNLMIEELDRANVIISEFLSIAQNKAVDLKLKDLDSILRALFPLLKADANYSGIQVKLELNNPPELLLDEGEIRQMILNLARNGIEAMPSGGVLIIGTMEYENEVVLFIKDQGQGIDPTMMDKLGTPFLTTKENGTGLGLAICYSIATHHNARITVETGPGGTTFRAHFPINPACQ